MLDKKFYATDCVNYYAYSFFVPYRVRSNLGTLN